MREEQRRYGYWDNVSEDADMLYGHYGRSYAGYGLGIIALEVDYPLVPGNVVNATTYDFPVRIKVVKGTTTERIFRNDRSLLDAFIKAAKELEEEGCRAIGGACGYFANFQKELSESVDIPVFSSALLQAPWIKMGLKKDQKIGVICAKGDSVTPEMLKSVGIEDTSYLVFGGLEDTEQFGTAVHKKSIDWINSIVREEVVGVAQKLAAENNLGAILLECSDLPPYAADIQRAVKLPVFDYISMYKWVQHAIMQKPYNGFI